MLSLFISRLCVEYVVQISLQGLEFLIRYQPRTMIPHINDLMRLLYQPSEALVAIDKLVQTSSHNMTG